MIGQVFGRWTVIARPKASRCIARCACGVEKQITTRALVGGATRMCRECSRGQPRRRHAPLQVGEVFGSWTVIGEAQRVGASTMAYHLCECGLCGTAHLVTAPNLRSGQSTRCKDCSRASGTARRHGLAGTKEHAAWTSMISRCHNENGAAFKNYGARGIVVAEEWRGRGGFERFFAHIGPAPSAAHSVDRIDNNDGYRPGNVRWATPREQMRNTRRSRLINVGGELLTMEEAGARLGISRQAIHQRISNGWTPIEAATTPKGEKPAHLRTQIGRAIARGLLKGAA